MATSKGIRAGRAFVELFADDKQLVRGLKAAQKKLKAWGKSIRAIGTRMFALGSAITAPLTGALTVFAQVGDSLDKMSARTGVSVETLSELGFAAEQTGSNLDAVGSALFRMRRRLANAATGGGPAVRALDDLGLSAEELTRLSPEDQFLTIASRLKQVKNESLAAQYAFEIFGDGAKSLLPLLSEGADGIEALRQQAREFGLTVSTEDATAAAEFTDALSILTKTMKSGLLVIGSALAPMMTGLAERISRVVKSAVDWIRENKATVLSVFRLGAALMVGGMAVIGLGLAFTLAGAALGAMASGVTMLSGLLGLILSPLGLTVALVTSLGVLLVRTSDLGAQALGWLTGKFLALKDRVLTTWQAIGDALAAGDIALAAKVLWLAIKLEWQQGVHAVNDLWASSANFFQAVWTEATHGVAAQMTNAWSTLESTWDSVLTGMQIGWVAYVGELLKIWHSTVGFLRKAWVKLKAMFDEDIDVDAEINRIDQETQKKRGEISGQQGKRISELGKKGIERQQQIEQNRTGALDELERMRQQEHDSRQQRHDDDMKASEAALQKARDEWQDAIAEAARRRKEMGEDDSGPGRNRFVDRFTGLDQLLGEVTQRTASVQGTFSAAGVRGLGSTGPEERTAKATEQTAKNTQKLLEEARNGGLTFG